MRFNVNKGILENLIYEMEVPEECGFLSYINTENALFAEAKKLEDSPVKSINDLVHFTYIRYALADICNIMIEENEKTRRVNCFGLFISDRDLRNNGLYTAAKSALQKMQKNEKFNYDLHQDLLYLDSVFYRRQHFYIQYKDKATVKNNTEVIDNMQVLYRCIQDWFQPTRTSSIVKILSDMMKVNVNNYLDQSTNQLFLLKVLYAIFAYEYGEKIKSKEDASSTPERGLLLAKIYRNPGLGNIEYYHFFSEEEELFDTAYGQYLDNLKKECVRLTFIDDGNYYSETNKLLMLDNWCELLCRRLYNQFLFIGSLYYTASVSAQLYSEHLKKAQTYAEYVENTSLLAESSKIAYSLAVSLEKKTITIIDSACSKLTFFTKNVDTYTSTDSKSTVPFANNIIHLLQFIKTSGQYKSYTEAKRLALDIIGATDCSCDIEPLQDEIEVSKIESFMLSQDGLFTHYKYTDEEIANIRKNISIIIKCIGRIRSYLEEFRNYPQKDTISLCLVEAICFAYKEGFLDKQIRCQGYIGRKNNNNPRCLKSIICDDNWSSNQAYIYYDLLLNQLITIITRYRQTSKALLESFEKFDDIMRNDVFPYMMSIANTDLLLAESSSILYNETKEIVNCNELVSSYDSMIINGLSGAKKILRMFKDAVKSRYGFSITCGKTKYRKILNLIQYDYNYFVYVNSHYDYSQYLYDEHCPFHMWFESLENIINEDAYLYSSDSRMYLLGLDISYYVTIDRKTKTIYVLD